MTSRRDMPTASARDDQRAEFASLRRLLDIQTAMLWIALLGVMWLVVDTYFDWR